MTLSMIEFCKTYNLTTQKPEITQNTHGHRVVLFKIEREMLKVDLVELYIFHRQLFIIYVIVRCFAYLRSYVCLNFKVRIFDLKFDI